MLIKHVPRVLYGHKTKKKFALECISQEKREKKKNMTESPSRTTSRTGNFLNQWNRLGTGSTDKSTTTVHPLPTQTQTVPPVKTKPPCPPTVTFPKIPKPVPCFEPVPGVKGSNTHPVRTVCGSAGTTKSRAATSGKGGPCDLCKCF
jgi:hypothetical protein